jgi:N-acetyl-gamma-glutamyl-phosphate reductase
MVQREAAGELAAEAVFSLDREHRHIPEIKRHAGLRGPVVFNPKIARAPRGIRMQVPLFGLARDTALGVLRDAYAGTSIVVDPGCPSRIPVDEWAHRQGACLRVFEQPEGCLVVCTLDNLGKGAVDSAADNIALMLGAG